MIKNKEVIKNSVIKNKKCNQELDNINKICLEKTKFMSHNNVKGIPDNYVDMIKYTVDNEFIKNIYVISHGEKSFIDVREIQFVISIVKKTILFCREEFDIKINGKFNLILLGSNAKKFFPNKGSELTEDNINSADVTFLGSSITIRIQRKEEMIKVLIHEVIHFTGIEKKVKSIKNKYNVNRKLLFNESVVEFLATYINCYIFSNLYEKDIAELLNLEINFGLLQTAKILDHFGISCINDFLIGTTKILQRTAAFEYHILKTILLINWKESMDILKKTGDFEELIYKGFLDRGYQKKVDFFIKDICNLKDNMKKTFRMTIVDILKK